MILITGSSGFVGQNLQRYLKDIPMLTLSLRNADKESIVLPNADVIVHLAGKAHDLKMVSSPDEYYHVNFELTKKIYDAFLVSTATKFIFISTVKAVADDLKGVLDENYWPDPQTHYGKSKLQAEDYIKSINLPTGKSYYILRPCMIHGPGNKGNLNLLYQFVSRGFPYPLASFQNKRSYLSIENLCFVIKELIDRHDIVTGVYNIADDEPLATTQVVSLLAQALKKRPNLLNVPPRFIAILAKTGDLLKLPFNSERVGKLTGNYIVSNQKIKAALNKELPMSSRDGILKTAQAFKKAKI